MKKFFADTNFFLRFLLNDVPSQNKIAENYLSDAKAEKIVIIVTPLVFSELTFLLFNHYKLAREEATKVLGRILTLPYLQIEERELLSEAMLLYFKHNLDFVDCFLFVKARANGAEVLSFDKDFKKMNN